MVVCQCRTSLKAYASIGEEASGVASGKSFGDALRKLTAILETYNLVYKIRRCIRRRQRKCSRG